MDDAPRVEQGVSVSQAVSPCWRPVGRREPREVRTRSMSTDLPTQLRISEERTSRKMMRASSIVRRDVGTGGRGQREQGGETFTSIPLPLRWVECRDPIHLEAENYQAEAESSRMNLGGPSRPFALGRFSCRPGDFQ